MGNSPPPVKSLPGIEARLASGIIFAVSSLWPNSGRRRGLARFTFPTRPASSSSTVRTIAGGVSVGFPQMPAILSKPVG